MSNRQLVGSKLLSGLFFTALLTVFGLSGCGSGGGDGSSTGASEESAEAALARRQPDTIPPTIPATLAASAVSSAQVDLAWSASTDNRTVAGYRIRRNGTLLPALGNVTSYEDIGLAGSTAYSYTVEAIDGAGNFSGQSKVAIATTPAVDPTPPTVSSTSPANAAIQIAGNSAITASFSEPMLQSTLNANTFKLATRGGLPITGTVQVSSTAATFTPSAVLAANTEFTATVTTGATDAAGNALGANFIWNFTTGGAPDTTAPHVSTMSPYTTGTAVNSSISVTFTEPMKNSTLTTSSFTVAPTSGGPAVSGTVSVSGNTARLTPVANLAGGTQYIATVTSAAQDAAGNALGGNFTWMFTTAAGAATDTTPPRVIATSPASAATGVALNASMSATFTEPMMNSTLTTASVRLATTSGGVAVGGTVFVSGNSVGFTPASPLVAGTQYTATITTAVKDAAGNAMEALFSWTFTTAATLDTTPPTVSSMSPANAATGVALNTSVSATFSEPMTNSTLTTANFSLATTSGGTAVAGTMNVSGNTATFTPNAPLVASTQYTATITTAVRDAAGNPLAVSFTRSFTTIVPGTPPPPPPVPGTPVACPVGGPPALSVVASRTTGVAPLAVFFDATATTSPLTTKSFRNIEYRWDFGDPAGSPISGTTWSTGSRPVASSRNSATGAITAHVFETPGNYTIAMTAMDGTNTASCSVQVSVQNPDVVYGGANTICLANGSAPIAGVGGCPSGAEVHGSVTSFSNASTGARRYIADGRRVLLKRGDVFTVSSSENGFNNASGWTLGAWGSGAKPVIRGLNQNGGLIMYGNSGTRSDVRIMDLNIDGANFPNTSGLSYLGGGGNLAQPQYYSNFLILRTDVQNVWNGFMTMQQTGVFIVDSTVVSTGYSSFSGGMINSAILGGSYTQTSTADVGQGNMRWGNANKFVMSNVTVDGGAANRQHIKVHSQDNVPSTLIIFSDNKFTGGADLFPFRISPQNLDHPESINNFIVERNWFVANSTSARYVQLSATHGTVRNNFFDFSRGTTAFHNRCVSIYREGAINEPIPDDIEVYNNTGYSTLSSGNSQGFQMIDVDEPGTGATNITVRNNLGYGPNYVSRSMLNDPFHRSVNTNNVLVTTPANTWMGSNGNGTGLFTDPPHFRLRSSDTIAVGQGFNVPVWSDVFRANQPSPRDIGAANH